jgi:pilus assembly protein Flp/PilA
MRVVWLGAHASERGEQGATAVEYAMLVALIAAVIFGTVVVLGGQVSEAFDSVIGLF